MFCQTWREFRWSRAMPDWSIKIIPNPSQIADQPALLVPDLVGAKPGDPLQVQEDDLVSWNNQTGQSYQPWPTDQNGNPQTLSVAFTPPGNPPSAPPPPPWFPAGYLSDMIPANRPSTPAYDVVLPAPPGNTIYYCLLDQNGKPTRVRGQIIVSAMPSAVNVPPVRG
jgi:hypothetical protein